MNEANAIGTVFLRTEFLPDPPRADARRAFADYAGVRARMSTLTWNQKAERNSLHARVLELQDRLWRQAAELSRQAPSPATTGLYVMALNQMIDGYSSYMAEVFRHVPYLVIFLLFSAFIVSGALMFLGGAHRRPTSAGDIPDDRRHRAADVHGHGSRPPAPGHHPGQLAKPHRPAEVDRRGGAPLRAGRCTWP